MEPVVPSHSEPDAGYTGRRRFLKRALALASALATGGRAGPGSSQQPPADPSKVWGVTSRRLSPILRYRQVAA
jgi:hypothetical protein